MDNARCITVTELGTLLGLSRGAAYNLANTEGFYPAFRIGSRLLISVEKLNRWIDEQTAAH